MYRLTSSPDTNWGKFIEPPKRKEMGNERRLLTKNYLRSLFASISVAVVVTKQLQASPLLSAGSYAVSHPAIVTIHGPNTGSLCGQF